MNQTRNAIGNVPDMLERLHLVISLKRSGQKDVELSLDALNWVAGNPPPFCFLGPGRASSEGVSLAVDKDSEPFLVSFNYGGESTKRTFIGPKGLKEALGCDDEQIRQFFVVLIKRFLASFDPVRLKETLASWASSREADSLVAAAEWCGEESLLRQCRVFQLRALLFHKAKPITHFGHDDGVAKALGYKREDIDPVWRKTETEAGGLSNLDRAHRMCSIYVEGLAVLDVPRPEAIADLVRCVGYLLEEMLPYDWVCGIVLWLREIFAEQTPSMLQCYVNHSWTRGLIGTKGDRRDLLAQAVQAGSLLDRWAIGSVEKHALWLLVRGQAEEADAEWAYYTQLIGVEEVDILPVVIRAIQTAWSENRYGVVAGLLEYYPQVRGFISNHICDHAEVLGNIRK